MFKNKEPRTNRFSFMKNQLRRFGEKISTRNFLCARYSMWFLLVFNSAIFSKAIELFTFLFEFSMFTMQTFIFHYWISHSVSALSFTRMFFSNRQALCCIVKYRKIFIGKLYFGLSKGAKNDFIQWLTIIWLVKQYLGWWDQEGDTVILSRIIDEIWWNLMTTFTQP